MPAIDEHVTPTLGIAAWSGTGKTTLLTALLPRLRELGLRVAVIKHAHHSFDVDVPGKDSYRLREAGAAPVLVASRERFALMQETPGQAEPDLNQLVAMLRPQAPDLILVEGFKAWPLPKLALYREEVGEATLLDDPYIEAVALPAASTLALAGSVERLDLDNIEEIAQWVLAWQKAWSMRA